MRYFYRKDQVLHKNQDVMPLFKDGAGLFCYPIKLIYREIAEASPEQPACKVMLVVGKRYLRKAYMRNQVRRRIREAYRLNINKLQPHPGTQIHLVLIYVGHNVAPYAPIERAVLTLLRNLAKRLHPQNAGTHDES